MANDFPKTPYDTWHQERIHPNAPAGGGGPGCFTTAGPLGASDSGWQGLPHPNSPAGRCLTAQDIRLPVLPERVESVVRAYFQALRLAPEAVYQETGYQLDQIKEGLLPGLLQMLAILGISVVAGTAAGTAIGFFLGGVGAAPGAVVGAELGLEIGIAVLTWLGLGFLAVAIGQGMGELTGVLVSGIRRAWLAPEHHHPQFEIDRAAEDLAKAEGILFRLILQGLLAYVLKNGAVSSSQAALSTGQTIARGGTRAAADETLAEVSALLRNSKLPDEFVVWIERNWEDLKRNPKLASNKTSPTVSSQASSSAASPSELKTMRERQGHDDVAETSGNQSQPVAERTADEKAAFGERRTRDNIASNKVTIDPNGNFSQSEINAAYHMAAQGKNVVLRSPTGTRAGGGTSDLLVDGVRYDVYTPSTGNPSRIISAIAKKNTQTEGIVLDISNSSVTREQLGDVLGRVNGAGATNISDIVIIGK